MDQALGGKGTEEGPPPKSQRPASGPALANSGDETNDKFLLPSPGLGVFVHNVEMTPPLYLPPRMVIVMKSQGMCGSPS